MRTDDMVREALADLAPVAPADSSALAGMHRAIGRRRRRQQVARIAAAVTFVALAVGAGAVMLRAEGDPADVSTDPDNTTPTTTPTTPDTTEGASARRTRFGPVTFQLPEGWEVVDQHPEQSPLGGPTGETMCIAPAGNPEPHWENCSGLLIHQGDFLPGNEWAPYQPDDYTAYSHSSDVPSCPTNPNTSGENFDGVGSPDGDTGAPVARETRPVGDHTAEYSRWRATCQRSDFQFEPEAWYLPESKVLIFDIFGHPETEDFLASFEFDE